MAWQLIYTSAPRGLVPGRSGFCTVARHREIRDGLVTAIERFSQYDRSGRGSGTPNPVVYAHRIVRLSGSSYHVLSRTVDAGADYSGRTNHLAHHLICEPAELAQAPSPAEVLRQMSWLGTWSEAPRQFGAGEKIELSRFSPLAGLPAQSWQAITGDAGNAALPLESGALAGCAWLYPAEAGEAYLLPLFAESLLLLDPAGRSAEKLWQVPFTTYLQSTDQAADFFWRGCWQGSPAGLAAQGARQTLDFSQPGNLRAPANDSAALARTGWAPATETEAPVEAASSEPTPAEEAEPEVRILPPPPEPFAGPRGIELDLAELLASADGKERGSGPWAKAKSEQPTAAGRAREKAGPRKLPLPLLIAAGVAVLALAGTGIGYYLWQGKLAELSSELVRTRNNEDFTGGRERAKQIEGMFLFRRQAGLMLEVEKTKVAAELNDLGKGTPEEANGYLTNNRQRLDALPIKEDEHIQKRINQVKKWRDTGDRLNDLSRKVAGASLPKPGTEDEIRRSLELEEKDQTKVDLPYQASIRGKLAEIRQAYVLRRLDVLEKLKKAGETPPSVEESLALLGRDATASKVSKNIADRIDNLNPWSTKPQVSKQPPVEPVAKGNPPVESPVKVDVPKNAPGLPTLTTYIANGSATGFDLSGVSELQGGTMLPANGEWSLFLSPEPTLNPQGLPSEKMSSTGGLKLYNEKSNVMFTLSPPQFVVASDLKATLGSEALLRFVPRDPAAKGFQILFVPGEPKSTALLSLPLSMPRAEGGRPAFRLESELATHLNSIKSASAANAFLVLRCRPPGLNPLTAEASSFDKLILDLTPEIQKYSSAVTTFQQRLAPGERSLATLKDVQSARDYLLKTEEFAYLGRTLFKAITKKETNKNKKEKDVPALGGQPLESIDGYLTKNAKDSVTPSLDGGEAILKYITELAQQLTYFIENDGQRERARNVSLDLQKMIEFPRSETERAAKFWQFAAKELPKMHSKPEEKIHSVADVFLENWGNIFTEENRGRIQPFLEWSGGNVGEQIKQAEKALLAPRRDLANNQATLQKLQGDLSALGPFSVDLELRTPPRPKTVKLIEFIATPADKPGETK